jgi:hypothetical protein
LHPAAHFVGSSPQFGISGRRHCVIALSRWARS